MTLLKLSTKDRSRVFVTLNICSRSFKVKVRKEEKAS